MRVRRRLARDELIEGFVVGLTGDWVLIATLSDDVKLDGFSALRLADLRLVRVRSAAQSLTAKLLQLDEQWPPTAPEGVDLSSTERLVATSAERFGLVGLSYEHVRAGALFIGVPGRVTKRNRLELRTVSPQAVWDPGVMTWPLREVTGVTFGSAYNAALLRVAGPPLPRVQVPLPSR